MIIDCISDLHGYYPNLEGGDLLIIAGDCTARDRLLQWADFFHWIKDQNYNKKILIAGNHDNFMFNGFPKTEEEAEDLKEVRLILQESESDFEYLCDSGTEFEGLKIWGSPWTNKFKGMNPHCMAFTVDRDEDLCDKWDKIPHDTDILITHSPPNSIMDGIPVKDGSFYHAGSKSLFGWLKYVERPKLHIFGHIHEGYGKTEVFPTYDDKMMISVNASHVNENYEPVNKPIRVVL